MATAAGGTIATAAAAAAAANDTSDRVAHVMWWPHFLLAPLQAPTKNLNLKQKKQIMIFQDHNHTNLRLIFIDIKRHLAKGANETELIWKQFWTW